jgi:hypothetical protein
LVLKSIGVVCPRKIVTLASVTGAGISVSITQTTTSKCRSSDTFSGAQKWYPNNIADKGNNDADEPSLNLRHGLLLLDVIGWFNFCAGSRRFGFSSGIRVKSSGCNRLAIETSSSIAGQ